MDTRAHKRAGAAGPPTSEGITMPEQEAPDKLIIHRPARVHLSPEETRARMETFDTEREEAFVAAVREDAD